jgi:type II secretory pathway component PulJ
MEHFFLQVFGLDSYGWLIAILIAAVVALALWSIFLLRQYLKVKDRLHEVTADSISAYAKISEAMNHIRTDLQNFTLIGTRSNDTIHRLIEQRLDGIDRRLESLWRDVLGK